MGKYIEKNNSHGFTLLELIVVLAGLGILSSLAIPNVIKYLDYAKVDEAKSLLDSAAADCLQGLRREGTNRLDDPLSENIISDDRLENSVYVFVKNANKCGDTMMARNKNDEERLLQLGFRISGWRPFETCR